LAVAGCEVVIGSRDAERAITTAGELSERVAAAAPRGVISGASNAAAVQGADFVIVTVPFEAQAPLLVELEPHLQAPIVISTAIPVRFDPLRGPVALAVAEGSAAEQAAALLPRTRVVAALHSVSNVHLGKLERALDEDILVTGDDDQAKVTVIGLIERIPGLRAVDAGPLANAGHSERLTVLLLSINRRIKRSVGIRLTNL